MICMYITLCAHYQEFLSKADLSKRQSDHPLNDEHVNIFRVWKNYVGI